MTLNLTELKDEPLGKNPIQAMTCGSNLCNPLTCYTDVETGQLITAPDDMRSFTIDVDGLSDEALDMPPARCTEFCATVPVQCIF